MDRRFAMRLQSMVKAANIGPEVLADLLPRLERFLQPFLESFPTVSQREHATHYIHGLLSDLESKTAEGIAYLHDQDRQPLQRFLGQSEWDSQPLVDELARQVAAEWGEPDGVLVFDPSGFAKKGTQSVGVARQWCGRQGKVDNCQVATYLAYVSRKDHALIDMRLYLPREWTNDPKRMRAAGVPKGTRFQTRHEQALAMLDQHGKTLPHAWITGDDEMGHSAVFREELRSRGECYLLAVPSNTLVRDLEATPPKSSGHGSPPKVPFVHAARWAAGLAESRWTRLEVRPTTTGPLIVDVAAVRVQTMHSRSRLGPEDVLFVTRERQSNGGWKHDYWLSNASAETPLPAFARVANAEHRVEECLQRAKGEAGLADSEARTWGGWHHHQILSLIATWFLTRESRREKKPDPERDRAPTPRADRLPDPRKTAGQHARTFAQHHARVDDSNRHRSTLSLEAP